jgi:hypothetical protein
MFTSAGTKGAATLTLVERVSAVSNTIEVHRTENQLLVASCQSRRESALLTADNWLLATREHKKFGASQVGQTI